jgi:hypothetical protein
MTDQAHPVQPEPAQPDAADAEGQSPGDTILVAFAPVPRRFNRGDVWTEEVQRAFIDALADTGSVEAACRIVGRSPASAYRLRRHPLGGEFAAAWQAAVDFGVRRIEDYAIDRAVNGVEVPVFAYGDQVATRRVYNDQLVMFMLRNRVPERYCSGGARALNAVDRQMLDRLKKQWREEWERERLDLDLKEQQEDFAAIDRWLETMRENRWNNMSPRARAAYEEADRIAKEDGTDWMLDEIEAEEADGEIRIPMPPPGWRGPSGRAEGEEEPAADPGDAGGERPDGPADQVAEGG